MKTGIIIAVSVLSGLFLLSLLLRFIMNKVKKSLELYIATELKEEKVLKSNLKANFFGFASKGNRQMRGNGALLLTETELIFVMALPRMEHRISLKEIREIDEVDSFKGKRIFRKLLSIKFDSEGGEEQAVWYIEDLELWKNALKKG